MITVEDILLVIVVLVIPINDDDGNENASADGISNEAGRSPSNNTRCMINKVG